jgi:hypothetical protein
VDVVSPDGTSTIYLALAHLEDSFAVDNVNSAGGVQ